MQRSSRTLDSPIRPRTGGYLTGWHVSTAGSQGERPADIAAESDQSDHYREIARRTIMHGNASVLVSAQATILNSYGMHDFLRD